MPATCGRIGCTRLLLLLLEVLLLDELLLEDLVDLLGGHADGLVAGVREALDLGGKDDELGLVQLNGVLTLDEGPVDALEDALLNRLLVAFEGSDQELHVSFNEEDLPFLLLTEGIQLQDLDQALAGLLDDGNLEVVRQQLHADIEVAEDVVDVASDLFLARLHHLIESAQQVVVDVEQQLDAPLLLVRQHRLD